MGKKVTVKKGNKTYRGTNGKDTIEIVAKAGNKTNIIALGNNDIIKVRGGSDHTIDAGDGSDKLYVYAGKVKKATLGNGNDIVSVTGGTLKSVNLGAGKNKITITGGTVSTVTGGSGTDIINVSKQKKITIKAGNGNNEVTINGINSGYFSAVSRGIVITGNAEDTITINKGGYYKISTDRGNDKVNINGGTNYVNTGSGNDQAIVKSKYSNAVAGDAGNDTITLKGSSYSNVIYGGDGNDTIIIKNNNMDPELANYVEGGAGNDTYHIYNPNTGLLLYNGSAAANDKDVINFHCSQYDIKYLDYYALNDTLVINGRIYIGGISSIDKVKVTSGSAVYEYSANEVLAISNYKYSDLNLDAYCTEFAVNFIKVFADNGVTDEIARRMGYKGK